MAGTYVLLQFGADPWPTRFEDLEGRLAFTVYVHQNFFRGWTSGLYRQAERLTPLLLYLRAYSEVVEKTPNLLLKMTREAPWAQQHPEIMGPSSSFFYFGPSCTPGYLVYGNSPTQAMANSRRQKKDGSVSRYFTAQNGKEYKWKTAPQKMECFDSKGVAIAIWEVGQLEDDFHARLSLKRPGLAVVTEVLTTLTLNRIAHTLSW